MAFTINSDELMNASTASLNNAINSSKRLYDKVSTVKIPADFSKIGLVNQVVQSSYNVRSKTEEVKGVLDGIIKKLVATGQLKSDSLRKFDIPDLDTLRTMSREQLMEYNLTADEINEIINQLAEEGVVPQEWTNKNIGEAMASSSEKYDISTILPLSFLIFRATNDSTEYVDGLMGDNTGNNVFGFTRYLPEGAIQSEQAYEMPEGRSFEEYMDMSVYTVAARLSNREAIASDTVNNYYHDWFLTSNNWYDNGQGNGEQPGNEDSERAAKIISDILNRTNNMTITATDVNSDPALLYGEANSPAPSTQTSSPTTGVQTPSQLSSQIPSPANNPSPSPAPTPTGSSYLPPSNTQEDNQTSTQTPVQAPAPTQTPAPTAQQPTAQQPTAQQPTTQQPTAQQPTAQQPTAQQQTEQQQTVQQPAEQQPAAQQPAEQTPAPTSSGQTYTVQSGDTLGKIAKRYGTTVEDLVRLNGIQDENVIGVDQVLNIPNGQYTSSGQSYTVQSGDTLGKIAARYGTTVEAIATLNGIQDANVIGVDQVLILPGNEQGN